MTKLTRVVTCAALSGALLATTTGCRTTAVNAVASAQPVPNRPEIDAKLVPMKGKVTGEANVTAFQFLFFNFGTGQLNKKIGKVTDPLLPPGAFWSLQNLNPFQSPVDHQSALQAAYYDAIENSDADALMETRAKVEGFGFSLFGIIGYGKAAASITGKGLKIENGKPRFAIPVVNVR